MTELERQRGAAAPVQDTLLARCAVGFPPRACGRERCPRGVTLLELLMVLVLIGLLAALAWPDFAGATADQRLHESAQRIRALASMCRAEAMNQTTRYRIELRRDGTLRVRQQADPVLAPHLFLRVAAGWASSEVLMSDVWVEAVELLPEGPPPIFVIDDKLELETTQPNLMPVSELERVLNIDFVPDGSSPSARLLLRDICGLAVLVTLDGRLGRVLIDDRERVSPDAVHRPDPLPPEEEPAYNPEDYS